MQGRGNMRIAEYIDTLSTNMVYCSAAINKEYMVQMADEHFYHFLGKTVGICMADSIHPDLREEFCQAFDSLEPGRSVRILTAMRGMEDSFQQVDLTISDNGHTVNGVKVWDLTIYNLFTIEEKYLQASNDANKYRALLSMYQEYLFDYDVEQDIIAVFRYVGIKSTVLVKCSLKEFREKVCAMYPRKSFQEELEVFCQHLLSAQENFSCDLRGPIPRHKTIMGLFHIEGKVIYKHNNQRMVLGILRMMDQKVEDAIPYYATAEGKDSFTGLLNKRACAEYVAETLASDSEVHYMAMIDIDNFKNINDTYGHMYGDKVISQVASIINGSMNGRGIVGRFGGDEFFIFTNWINTEMQLRAVLTSIRKRVQSIFENREESCKVTLSIGISKAPTDGCTYDELFRKADKCLYLAKFKGKNRFVIYEEDKHGDIVEEGQSIRHTMDPLEKAEYLADVVADIGIRLFSEGVGPMEEIMDQIRSAFEIDGVRIYRAGQTEPVYISGDYQPVPDMHSFITGDELIKVLNQPHYLMASHITNLEGVNRELFELLRGSRIEGMVCFCYQDKNGVNLYFFYEAFNHRFRWSESDKNFLLTVSKLMANVL